MESHVTIKRNGQYVGHDNECHILALCILSVVTCVVNEFKK